VQQQSGGQPKPNASSTERPSPIRPNYLGLLAVNIETIGAVTFFSAFFFFFSLFLGLLSPIFNTPNHTSAQLYSILEIIASSSLKF
jgi:hypothetical protein